MQRWQFQQQWAKKRKKRRSLTGEGFRACGSIDDGDNKRRGRFSSRLFFMLPGSFFISPFFCFFFFRRRYFLFPPAFFFYLFVCMPDRHRGLWQLFKAKESHFSSRRHALTWPSSAQWDNHHWLYAVKRLISTFPFSLFNCLLANCFWTFLLS